MVVTTLHKLIGLSVAMLGQAPGTDLLNQWTRLYTQSREDGMNAMAALQRVAQHILDSAAFAEMHPAYLIIEDSDFAQRFLDSVLGETASADMVTLVVGLLNSGTSRAEVAVRAVEYLLEVNHQGSDHADYPTFGTYAMRFGNQVEVARYYTVDKKWMTPGKSVLDEVDDTAASVTAVKSDIDGMQQPGKNFTLTTGVDQFTGTPGNDTFVATESTLNGADRLDGKEGMDTLELSSGSGANENISIPRGAMVSHIETLSVTSDGDFSGDVSKWEGLKTVQLEVVKDVDLELKAGDGTKVTSTSLGDDDDASKVTIENAGMVALESVSKHAQVNIMGEGTTSVMVQGGKGMDVNSAASPSMTVKSVTLDGVHDGMGKDGKRYGTGENKDSVPVHIYSKAIENLTLRNTNTTLLVQNDDKDMTELTAMVDRFGNTANGYGKLCLKGIEDLTLQVAGDSNIRLASDQIKQVEVSGAGDLHLHVTKFAPAVAEKAADLKASTTLESLMLSGSGKFTLDAKGLSKLKTVDAGEATGAVEIKNLGNSVKEYTGSMGKDTVSVAAFNSKGLMADLGAGDDTFTVDNLSAGNSKIDGGAGMDTLVLKQTDGAKVKGAGDAYRNFETITLEAGGGKGTYDLKGLDIDELKISSNVAAAAGVKFKNVTPGTDLTVSSTTTGNTLAIVDYALESGQGSRFGSSGNMTLNLNLRAMGGKDDTAATAIDISKRGVLMQLVVDDDIDTLIIDTSAMLNKDNANKVKTMNYLNTIVFMDESGGGAGDKIEQIKVTGNAMVRLTTSARFKHSTDNQGNTKAVSLTTSDNQTKALTALEYVDARENTGGLAFSANNSGVEVHGSPVDDIIVAGWGGTNNSPNYKDKLMGYGGNDFIAGGTGEDQITGGAGGDIMSGGPANTRGPADGILMSASLRLSIPDVDLAWRHDSRKDTFIYIEASDSQIDLNKMSGFDIIGNFEGDHDVIDLRKVVDLRGTIKNGNTAGGGGQMAGKAFAANTANNTLKKFIDNGDGVFETSKSNELGGTRHSIVLVDTQEDDFIRYKTKSADNDLDDIRFDFSKTIDDLNVKWVLIDVDGDGDFDAGIDMAIALPDSNGTVDTGNFM